MKDGRIVVEALKLSSVARHHNLVEPAMSRVIYGADPQTPWLAKEFTSSPTPSRPEPAVEKSRDESVVPDPEEDAAREEGAKTLCVPGPSARKAVLTLRKKTLKVSARVPRLLPVKLSPQSKKGVEEPMKLEAVVEAHPLPIPESVPVHEPVVAAQPMDSPMEKPIINLSSAELPPVELPSVDIPPHVQVKVIPTPKREDLGFWLPKRSRVLSLCPSP